MNIFAFIDTFTTHNDMYGKNNCPIQFCCDIHSEDELYDLNKLMTPSKRKMFNIIPDEEIMTQGYLASGYKSPSEYEGHPLEKSLLAIYTLLSKLRDTKCYIIGFNHINYDLKHLNVNFKRILNKEPIVFDKDRVIDVMDIAENMITVDKIGNYSMDAVYMYLFENRDALYELKKELSTANDIKITKMIFCKLLDKMSDKMLTLSDIYELNEINRKKVDVLNFGKYKGISLNEAFELDSQYMNWLLNNKQMQESKPYLIETIREMYNTRIV